MFLVETTLKNVLNKMDIYPKKSINVIFLAGGAGGGGK